MVLLQKKEKKEEYVRKIKEATLTLMEEKSELKEELQAARENVVRMTQSRDGLQEGMTSKRSTSRGRTRMMVNVVMSSVTRAPIFSLDRFTFLRMPTT